MKQLSLNVEARANAGRGPCRRIRASGKVPAVVYGVSGARNLAVGESDLRTLMRTLRNSVALIELTNGQEKTLSVLRRLDRDSVKDSFVHADFHEVSLDKEMTVGLGILLKGESIGVRTENGLLEVVAHRVNVRGLPKNLPEILEVDVTELHAGHAIHVRDLKPIAGVVFADDKDTVVINCTKPDDGEEEAAAGDAAAAPAAAAGAPAAAAPAAEKKA